MNKGIQKAFAWAGPIFVALLTLSFWMLGFLPPISPTMSPEALADHIEERRAAFRIGATMTMQFGFLMFLWVASISAQIRRIEANHPPLLTYAQLMLGLAANLVFLLATLVWTVAAFRPERDPSLLALYNDFAWLSLVMPAAPLVLQAIVIGVAILSDRRAAPLFPRWAAYFNFWVGLLFAPGAVTTFFKTGPFAWNGLLVFWVPILAFFAWIVVMAWLVSRAVDVPDEKAA